VESNTCFCCKANVYHPATGHRFNEDVVYCGPCYRYFLSWMKGHVRRKWSGADFYVEAANCVKFEVPEGTSLHKKVVK
jgi:hypothetical protein